MKHKTGSRSFSKPIQILVVAIIVLVCLPGWFVIRRNSNNNSQNWSKSYVPGTVQVTFKDGVTYGQAADLVKSYGLNVQNSQTDMKMIFSPSVTTGVRHDKGTSITDKLKQNPIVVSITEDHQDPYNDIHFFTINFKDGTTTSNINQTLTAIHSLHYEDSNKFEYNPAVIVEVPLGQENTYKDKFKQNSIVLATSLWNPPIDI